MKISESNWLKKKEKIIKKSTLLFIGISLIEFVLIFIKPIRNYHFDDFSDMHFIGIILLFLFVISRIILADRDGKDPYMEVSRG